MAAKKTASLKGLIFRELYLGRRTYIAVTSIFLGIVALIFLVLLSMECGNLAKLPEDVLESAKGTIRIAAMFVPAAIFFMNTSVVVDMAPADLDDKWTRFLYSSPVSEARYLGVKYGVMFFTAVIGYAFSALLAFVFGNIMGESAAVTDFAVISVIMLLVVLFATVISVLAFLFKSTTVAVVVTLIGGYIGMMALIFATGIADSSVPEEDLFSLVGEAVSGFAQSVFPLSPVILIVIIAGGWAATTAVLKNRDRKAPNVQLFAKKEKAENTAAKEG